MTDEIVPLALRRRASPSPALRARVLAAAREADATPWWWSTAVAAAIVLMLNTFIVPTTALEPPAQPELVAKAMELRRTLLEH